MADSIRRTVAKSVSWRAISVLTTFGAVFLVSGQLAIASAVAAIDLFVKTFTFFIHERIWNRIKWGKVHRKND